MTILHSTATRLPSFLPRTVDDTAFLSGAYAAVVAHDVGQEFLDTVCHEYFELAVFHEPHMKINCRADTVEREASASTPTGIYQASTMTKNLSRQGETPSRRPT